MRGMKVEIIERPEQTVVALLHVGPYHEIGGAFGKLWKLIMSNGVPAEGSLAIYHDDPTEVPPEKLRSHACAEVDAGFVSPSPELEVITIAAGSYAKAVHHGPYSGLGASWQEFIHKITGEMGLHFSSVRPSFEVYVNDCSQVAEEDLITELFEGVEQVPSCAG